MIAIFNIALLTVTLLLSSVCSNTRRRLDRRIGVLIPNSAARGGQQLQQQQQQYQLSTTLPIRQQQRHQSTNIVNELDQLGVDVDDLTSYARRVQEDTGNDDSDGSESRQLLQQLLARTSSLKTDADDEMNAEYHLMKQYFLRSNRTASCNDGSRAGSVCMELFHSLALFLFISSFNDLE